MVGLIVHECPDWGLDSCRSGRRPGDERCPASLETRTGASRSIHSESSCPCDRDPFRIRADVAPHDLRSAMGEGGALALWRHPKTGAGAAHPERSEYPPPLEALFPPRRGVVYLHGLNFLGAAASCPPIFVFGRTSESADASRQRPVRNCDLRGGWGRWAGSGAKCVCAGSWFSIGKQAGSALCLLRS